jgi:hypothetical protein
MGLALPTPARLQPKHSIFYPPSECFRLELFPCAMQGTDQLWICELSSVHETTTMELHEQSLHSAVNNIRSGTSVAGGTLPRAGKNR